MKQMDEQNPYALLYLLYHQLFLTSFNPAVTQDTLQPYFHVLKAWTVNPLHRSLQVVNFQRCERRFACPVT